MLGLEVYDSLATFCISCGISMCGNSKSESVSESLVSAGARLISSRTWSNCELKLNRKRSFIYVCIRRRAGGKLQALNLLSNVVVVVVVVVVIVVVVAVGGGGGGVHVFVHLVMCVYV